MAKMTGLQLVAFARSKINTPYVYGMKGEVMSKAKYDWLKKTYGDLVWDSDSKKIGKVCVDCSGLISWACGVMLGSTQWMNKANVKKPISTISEAPVGALVWMQGHIGIYVGKKIIFHIRLQLMALRMALEKFRYHTINLPIGY